MHYDKQKCLNCIYREICALSTSWQRFCISNNYFVPSEMVSSFQLYIINDYIDMVTCDTYHPLAKSLLHLYLSAQCCLTVMVENNLFGPSKIDRVHQLIINALIREANKDEA